jgi:hypothetical protein
VSKYYLNYFLNYLECTDDGVLELGWGVSGDDRQEALHVQPERFLGSVRVIGDR